MRQDNQIFYRKIQAPFLIKSPALACGSQTKNTVCFAKGNALYFGRLHPDLSNPKDFSGFEQDIKYFLKKNPRVIACDLHPEYQSTKYALSLSTQYPILNIQHHHAHIASCMAENGLRNQKVIGVAFDGTGLGSDNTIWGAEFLFCDYKHFQRKAYLREIPLLGGERAILEPYRMALAWLYLIYKEKFLSLDIPFIGVIDKNKWQVLKKLYLSGFNSPLVSSMGRLFDAAASLILAKSRARFEAELAIELEKLALRYALSLTGRQAGASPYNFNLTKRNGLYVIDPVPVFKGLIADLRARRPTEKTAYRFHLTVSEIVGKTCSVLRRDIKNDKVVLSGGVFQNSLLLRLSLDLLCKQGFKVFTHQRLSSNDSCVSLGEAVIAGFAG
ncbi:MAG: hypothetical protein WC321_06715 [Candidatus Omnitrophota bacterium]|jgi:hydrogenase maturation protein HypF